jgi:hypothetical protein
LRLLRSIYILDREGEVAGRREMVVSDILQQGCDPVLDPDFDGPVSLRELDALDAIWKPVGLLAAAILGGSRMMAGVERYLDWRDLWNDRRNSTYSAGDEYDYSDA